MESTYLGLCRPTPVFELQVSRLGVGNDSYCHVGPSPSRTCSFGNRGPGFKYHMQTEENHYSCIAYCILDRNCTIASERYGRKLHLTTLFVASKLSTQRIKVNQVIRLFSRFRLPQSIRFPSARTSACQDDWPCHQYV
jgi:hypothetical protein